MTPQLRWAAIIGVVLGLFLLLANTLVGVIVIALAIAAPVGFWLALGPSNRRRIRGMRNRGQLP